MPFPKKAVCVSFPLSHSSTSSLIELEPISVSGWLGGSEKSAEPIDTAPTPRIVQLISFGELATTIGGRRLLHNLEPCVVAMLSGSWGFGVQPHGLADQSGAVGRSGIFLIHVISPIDFSRCVLAPYDILYISLLLTD